MKPRLFLSAILLIATGMAFGGRFDDVAAKAQSGDVDAQCQLGVMYLEGRYAPTNYQKAFFWLKKASEQGCVEGQYRLGEMYDWGRGTQRDDAEAFYWYAMSAEGGHKKAQYHRALKHQTGMGTVVNYEQAFHWAHQSALQGFGNGVSSLASMYYLGQGTPTSFFKAYVWASVGRACGSTYSEGLRARAAEHLSPDELMRAQDEAMAIYDKMGECGY